MTPVLIAACLMTVSLTASGQELSDQEVTDAIELGRAGNVPIPQVGTFLGASKGDFNVYVEGPVGRIAAAASKAFKQLRPFGLNNVTNEMRARVYRVFAERDYSAGRRVGPVQHIVLQPKGTKGLDAAFQPLRESGDSAYFERFPEGEFDVVIATASGIQRYNVSLKDRARIDAAPIAPEPPPNAPPPSAAPISSAQPAPMPTEQRGWRLLVQGDGKHIADAIQTLQAELTNAKVNALIVQRGQPYDYRIVFGQGDRDAAAAMMFDPAGEIVAVAVKGAFTEKGAAEGVARDLAKKLSALSR
jgi:hypothetical protein